MTLLNKVIKIETCKSLEILIWSQTVDKLKLEQYPWSYTAKTANYEWLFLQDYP